MYVFTKNVAGSAADVDTIVPPNVGTHEYQFKPEDVKKISDSDVVVKNGLGAEMWLDKLIESAGAADLKVIDTSQGVKTRQGTGTERGAGGVDVHTWLDPVRAVKQVENIRDGLARIDPDNRAVYQRNATAFIKRLRKLDADIRSEVTTFRTRDFVAFHSAFAYFAERYGLNQVAAIEEFPGKEPNPRQLVELETLVKEKHLKALFTEPQFSPRLVDQLARDLGVDILVLDPIETGQLGAGYWEDMMRRNLANLKKAMD